MEILSLVGGKGFMKAKTGARPPPAAWQLRRAVRGRGRRGAEVREAIREEARVHDRAVREGQRARRSVGEREQLAHRDAQLDVDDVVAGAAAVREAGNVAA